jgi:hypothetical protein
MADTPLCHLKSNIMSTILFSCLYASFLTCPLMLKQVFTWLLANLGALGVFDLLVIRSIDLCCIYLTAAGHSYLANLAAGQSCSWLISNLAALAAFDLLISIF